MSTTSDLIKMTLQALNENEDTWGTVLNVSALELLEDAIAGTADVGLLSTADYTLDDTAGGPTATDGARYMILDVNGSPGGATNVIVPTRSKVYLAWNNTGDASSIVVKTAAGSGVTIANGNAVWVFCDGTNVVAATVNSAVAATTATTASNSTSLGGTAASGYAKLATTQTFTAGQVVQRGTALTVVAGDVTANLALSNSFYHLTTQGFNLAAPTNMVNGSTFSLVVEQGAGAPHAITFQASTFLWKDGTAPTLSTSVGDIDYLAFEYCTNLSIGNRWIGSIIKDVS